MPGLRLATLVRRLRRDTAADGAGVSDAELLGRFVRSRDDAAFEPLVWRHGAMVLGACRRVLGNPADAEDAFQAVFLVLARKAASVARGQALPVWLHRVAMRLALRLARLRRPIADLAIDPPAAVACDPVERDELRGVLDAEIDRLPAHCRRAVVLCYLEGLRGSEAARLLATLVETAEFKAHAEALGRLAK
jgi:RNA polymerase sigma factor (sigma-70 family)